MIYLDYQATTPLAPEALDAMLPWLRDGFANRRSPEYLRLHGLPPEAENESHEAWVSDRKSVV